MLHRILGCKVELGYVKLRRQLMAVLGGHPGEDKPNKEIQRHLSQSPHLQSPRLHGNPDGTLDYKLVAQQATPGREHSTEQLSGQGRRSCDIDRARTWQGGLTGPAHGREATACVHCRCSWISNFHLQVHAVAEVCSCKSRGGDPASGVSVQS